MGGEATTETPDRKTVRCEAEKERRKGCEFPSGWGRQEDNCKLGMISAGRGEERSTHQEQSMPARGFAALLLCTNQSSSLLCLHQEMKLHLGLPHLWFLLGSPRAVRHHPDPRGLLPPLKVLWHLKNNAAFT